MADTGSHPDTHVRPDPEAPSDTSRWQKAVATLGVLVVVWVGGDTYDVIAGNFGGGGNHGPGQDTPVENQDQDPDTGTGGGHTPGPPEGGH